jgi:hypothetical protein
MRKTSLFPAGVLASIPTPFEQQLNSLANMPSPNNASNCLIFLLMLLMSCHHGRMELAFPASKNMIEHRLSFLIEDLHVHVSLSLERRALGFPFERYYLSQLR